jgi:hypothetical protein
MPREQINFTDFQEMVTESSGLLDDALKGNLSPEQIDDILTITGAQDLFQAVAYFNKTVVASRSRLGLPCDNTSKRT